MRYAPKTRPRGYQAKALKRAFKFEGHYGLFLEPRTGKSKVAVDFAAASWQQGKVKRVLLVCQLSGWPVWEDEFIKHCPVDYELVFLPRGSKEKIRVLKSLNRNPSKLQVVVINYESTWRIEKYLLWYDPDLVIYDEGHKIKNRLSKQAKCAHRLIMALDPLRLLLTGTPITGKPLDVFSQYFVIDDSVFGRQWTKFERRYATYHGFYNREVKYKNLPDLARRARSRATVLTKEECLDLPKRSYEPVYVNLAPRTRKAYDSMEKEFITIFGEHQATAAIKLTQMMRLSQISGGFVKTEDGVEVQVGSEKLDRLTDLLDELVDAGEKVVVFARFRWEIDAIEKICQKNKWKSFKYYGPVSGERVRYPMQFQAHDGPAVFIAQTQTGSLSIDLDRAAYCIFYSMDYNLVNWTQDHDRLLANQKRPVTYMYLLARKTIDKEVWESLQGKKQVSTLLNNNSPFLKSLTNRV